MPALGAAAAAAAATHLATGSSPPPPYSRRGPWSSATRPLPEHGRCRVTSEPGSLPEPRRGPAPLWTAAVAAPESAEAARVPGTPPHLPLPALAGATSPAVSAPPQAGALTCPGDGNELWQRHGSRLRRAGLSEGLPCLEPRPGGPPRQECCQSAESGCPSILASSVAAVRSEGPEFLGLRPWQQ